MVRWGENVDNVVNKIHGFPLEQCQWLRIPLPWVNITDLWKEGSVDGRHDEKTSSSQAQRF